MKKLTVIAAAITLLVAIAGLANATLILGDEVVLSYRWPGAESVIQEKVVAVGGSGVFTFHDGVFQYIVDVESDGIFVNFPDPGLFSGSEFIGLVVEGIETSTTPQISTDFAGWDNSRIVTGPDTLGFNWSGFHTVRNGGGTYFNIEEPAVAPFAEPTAANAPEPATMFLLGSGLAGLAAVRRKFGK